MLDGPGSAPAQGDVLRGVSGGGGYENAGFKAVSLSDGDTISVATTDRIIHATGSATDSNATWTVSLGNGSYAGQRLVLVLTAEVEDTDLSSDVFTVAMSNIDRRVSTPPAEFETETATASFDLVWDGSAWQTDKPGINRSFATITGTDANAEGRSTTASGDRSHAEGGGTNASGAWSHAEGDSATASGVVAHAEGGGTNASGSDSHAEGSSTTASGSDSHAGGTQSEAYLKSQFARANGQFSAKGDAQYTIDSRRLSGGSGSMTRSIPADKLLNCWVQVAVLESGAGSGGRFDRQVSIKNDGGTTALVGSVTTIGADQDPDGVGYSLSITADDSGDNLSIDVSGGNSGTRWVVTIYATEVANP
jgi:hypothetical protein